MEYKLHNGSGGLCCKGCSRQDKKLNTYDWLADIPGNAEESDMVEVQFKNTRKGYYRNSNKIKLEKVDIVAVEAAPGHDIGVVTLTGRLVPLQMKKANFKADTEVKRVYRKAKPVDMEKFNEAKGKEHATMIRARQIALNLSLNMKIGDVEYQGDGNKAIFYYIADERVDFRQLIKVLAEAFHRCLEGAPQEPSPGRDAEKGILQAGSGNLGTGSDPKGRTENRISQSVRAVKITEIEEIDAAFTYAKKIQKQGQALFCAGSLYLIGELERIAGGMQND